MESEELMLIKIIEIQGHCEREWDCTGCPFYRPGNNRFDCLTDDDDDTFVIAKQMLYEKYPSSYFDTVI